MLSIVETFKAFCSTLLGAKIEVYTDHKNLTYKMTQYTTQQVLRWRLIVEEYGPKFFYKPGSKNVVADALSRVPTTRLERESNEDKFLSAKDACLFTDDPELTECLLADPEFAECFSKTQSLMKMDGTRFSLRRYIIINSRTLNSWQCQMHFLIGFQELHLGNTS